MKASVIIHQIRGDNGGGYVNVLDLMARSAGVWTNHLGSFCGLYGYGHCIVFVVGDKTECLDAVARTIGSDAKQLWSNESGDAAKGGDDA